MKRLTRSSRYLILPLALFLLTISPSLFADGGANHRVQTNNYGVSGGNINDRTNRFCCSGTLGALVKDNNNVQYILSNNHVLARSDQGAVGDDVSQPGLIDNNCATPRIVADLVNWPRLGSSNVDAAMATLRSGTMRTDGFIEDIGIPCATPATATVNMSVAKSGRTTGFTTGSVQSVNTNVSVQYTAQCGGGRRFTVSYTNQIVVTPGTFSAGGDSGSLIVTNDSNHRPVGLLFAGSSSSTIANPIGQVLSQLGTALGGGRTVSFVGSNCTTTTSAAGRVSDQGPSSDAVEFATQAMRGRERAIMSRAGVIGMGVGTADENTGEAVIVVYVDITAKASPSLPRRINGVRVKRVFTEPFIAY